MKKIAIFGSGSGSNAENICAYFGESADIKVVVMCTNKKSAFIVKRAQKLNIPIVYTTKTDLENFSNIHQEMKNYNVDYIVLSGFLLKIPVKMVESFPGRIINIHPALLPKYGGKGMYGANVHKAVLANNEKESGITIHFVNQKYDEGKIILQKCCVVSKNDTIKSLENKIHDLEFKYFPKTIEQIILHK